ncbi:hypothetical protein CRUP_015112 [Coryphaenoides rupestris]|nr:hypothetical protein CRUP_015112 [Coryphaenoides rupestris]
MKYFSTVSSGLSNFPEFVAVGMVDGLQFYYYDSNTQRVKLKQVWMDQLTRDDPDYLERNTRRAQRDQQSYKVDMETLKQRFNQTGVHTVQVRMQSLAKLLLRLIQITDETPATDSIMDIVEHKSIQSTCKFFKIT